MYTVKQLPDFQRRMSCAICLEEVGSNGPAFWLGCHVFCTGCIIGWVPRVGSCPTCKTKVHVERVQDLTSMFPRRSSRRSEVTVMFTTDGQTASSVTSREMMERIENISV